MNTKYKLYLNTIDDGGIFSTRMFRSKRAALQYVKSLSPYEVTGYYIKKIK